MKVLLTLLFLFAVQACKHPLAIQGEGDIVDTNGSSHGCTLEQYQVNDAACVENNVVGDYNVNYEAEPHPGWRFVKWLGPCSPQSVEPLCNLQASAASLSWWDTNFSDVEIPPTVAVFTPVGEPTPYDHLVESVDSYFRESAHKGTFLMVYNNQVLLHRGYGLANQETGRTNKQDIRYRVGSVTKQFTAGAILMLEERGQLTTDDLVCDYLATCPSGWEQITIHQLLTHTSGLVNYTAISELFAELRTQILKPEELVASFSGYPLDFAPGADWNYSNSGYAVLGLILENITGVTYEQFLQENIFTPLGMLDSGITTDTHAPNFSTGYWFGLVAVTGDMSISYSAGAIYSNVTDLYKWERALYSDAIFAETTREKLVQGYVDVGAPGSSLKYGYGLLRDTINGEEYVLHDGSIFGYNSILFSSVNNGLTIIWLSNTSTEITPFDLLFAVLDVLKDE